MRAGRQSAEDEYGAAYVWRVMCPGLAPTHTPDMNDLDGLRRLLKVAIARRNEASPFSPEWDAAMSHLVELRVAARDLRLARLQREVPVQV